MITLSVGKLNTISKINLKGITLGTIPRLSLFLSWFVLLTFLEVFSSHPNDNDDDEDDDDDDMEGGQDEDFDSLSLD